MTTETIDDAIMRIYNENPSIEQKDFENKLKDIKDPFRPEKQYWKNSTIRNRVHTFLKSKGPKLQFAQSDKDKPSADVEGTEIKRHEDIFAPRVEPAIDASQNKAPETEFKAKKQELTVGPTVDLLDQKSLTNLSDDIKKFKHELVDIVSDIKTNVDKNIDSIKKDTSSVLSTMIKDMSSLTQEISKLKQTIALTEPEVKYDFLELKLPLIEQIKKTCEEQKIDDESDYVEELLTAQKERDEVLELRDEERHKSEQELKKLSDAIAELSTKITATTKELDNYVALYNASLVKAGKFDAFTKEITDSGGIVTLKLDYDTKTGQLGFKRGISTRTLIAAIAISIGLGIGIGVGIASSLKIVSFILIPFFL